MSNKTLEQLSAEMAENFTGINRGLDALEKFQTMFEFDFKPYETALKKLERLMIARPCATSAFTEPLDSMNDLFIVTCDFERLLKDAKMSLVFKPTHLLNSFFDEQDGIPLLPGNRVRVVESLFPENVGRWGVVTGKSEVAPVQYWGSDRSLEKGELYDVRFDSPVRVHRDLDDGLRPVWTYDQVIFAEQCLLQINEESWA